MLNTPHIAVAIVFLVLISACSHKPDRTKRSSETFETDIKSNGSKRFTLSIVEQATSKQNNKGAGDAQRGERGQRGKRAAGEQGKGNARRGSKNSNASMSLYEDNRARIIALLDTYLAKTQYCRHGYIEIAYSFTQGETELIGECQESASDDDRLKW